MDRCKRSISFRNVACFIGALSLTLASGCGNNSAPQQGSVPGVSATQEALPARGKITSASPPAKAAFGMIYVNTADKREYIFDGNGWVPHSKDVDSFYTTKGAAGPTVRTYGYTAADSCTSYDCNPGGAHRKHSGYSCTTCHMMHGGQRFDPRGPAVTPPTPANPNPAKPGFIATNKSCSNIACHGVPAGTFSYYFPGGDGEPVLNTVTYGGTAAAFTPSWYAKSAACASCHGNPPANYPWHSGQHATGIPGANDCQFCHPDASGSGGQGTTITNAALHKNGTVEVSARFTSKCFGCH